MEDIASKFLQSRHFLGESLPEEGSEEPLYFCLRPEKQYKPPLPTKVKLNGKEYMQWVLDGQRELGEELMYVHTRNRDLRDAEDEKYKKITEELKTLMEQCLTDENQIPRDDLGNWPKHPQGLEHVPGRPA